MRLLRFLTTGVTLVSYALAQDLTPEVSPEKHHYQVRHRPRSCGFGHKFKCVTRVMSPVFVRS
jgi:hypothetical protein